MGERIFFIITHYNVFFFNCFLIFCVMLCMHWSNDYEMEEIWDKYPLRGFIIATGKVFYFYNVYKLNKNKYIMQQSAIENFFLFFLRDNSIMFYLLFLWCILSFEKFGQLNYRNYIWVITFEWVDFYIPRYIYIFKDKQTLTALTLKQMFIYMNYKKPKRYLTKPSIFVYN